MRTRQELSSWQSVKIIDICNDSAIENLQPAHFKDCIIEYYSIPAFQENSKTPVLVKGHEIKSNKQVVTKNDVLYGKLNPNKSKVWKIKESSEHQMLASTEFLIVRIKEANRFDVDYIYHSLNSDEFKNRMISLAAGSTNSHQRVNPKSFYNTDLLFPPLPEQQKIAEILSTVDAKIENIDRQIAETEQLKKGLMQKLLTEGIGHTEFKDSPLGRIPKSWEVTHLEKHSENITKGSTPTTYGYGWTEEGVLFLRSECVSENGFSLRGAMRISPEANRQLKRSQIAGGDILITITGNIGRVCRFPRKYDCGNINQHIARIRITDKVLDDEFVLQYLSQSKLISGYKRIMTGQAYPQLSLKQIREILIPLPSIEEQGTIAEYLKDMDNKISISSVKRNHYESLKKGLMQKLLTGQIRVTSLLEKQPA